ncbi:MAG TPA: hypothetical protein VFR44_09530 [Actinomycetota bacterium]|nr:hypothetical protein [Actinomycetota bacterium]
MRPTRTTLIVGLTVLTSLMLVPPALADGDDVERHGSCSGSSRWELDLDREHGRIEVDFEVKQGVVGDRWRVKLVHDGDVFFRDLRTTHGDDGSFDVERRTNDAAGTDRFVGKAVNKSTGEVCRGTAAI